MKKLFAIPALLALAGCQNPAMQTANADAKVAANAIAQACQYAPVLLTVAASIAKGGAANTVSQAGPIISASCTVAGQAALAANDAAPVGPGNSGNSAAWLLTTAADALTAAAGQPVKTASN